MRRSICSEFETIQRNGTFVVYIPVIPLGKSNASSSNAAATPASRGGGGIRRRAPTFGKLFEFWHHFARENATQFSCEISRRHAGRCLIWRAFVRNLHLWNIYVISVNDRNKLLSFTKHEEAVCISILIGFERLALGLI